MVLFICFPSLFIEFLLTFSFQNARFLAPCFLQHLDSVVEKALPFRPISHRFPVTSSGNKTPRASVQKGTISFYYDFTVFICSMVPEEQDKWKRSLDCGKMLNVTTEVYMLLLIFQQVILLKP